MSIDIGTDFQIKFWLGVFSTTKMPIKLKNWQKELRSY